MDAKIFAKELGRMCKSYDDCGKCGMSKLRTEKYCNCLNDFCIYPAEAVRIVEEWSKAHPIQTNGDKFYEVFGWDIFNVLVNESWAKATTWADMPYEPPKGEDDGKL